MNIHTYRRLPPRRLLLLAVLLLAMLVPTFAMGASHRGDLGDAPDSTNHFSMGMLAYPGVRAFFPTVFDPAAGTPQGPIHLAPTAAFWLGPRVTAENDADLLPDQDGVTNIDPPSGAANRDSINSGDDGLALLNPYGLSLPQCSYTRFNYTVTGAAAPPVTDAYVNVWFDFNRDGDWNDFLSCVDDSGAYLSVPERAVANQPVTIAPGQASWCTPGFVSFHTGNSRDLWMRITISEIVPPHSGYDGSGWPDGYRYGETEDYYAVFNGSNFIPR